MRGHKNSKWIKNTYLQLFVKNILKVRYHFVLRRLAKSVEDEYELICV